MADGAHAKRVEPVSCGRPDLCDRKESNNNNNNRRRKDDHEDGSGRARARSRTSPLPIPGQIVALSSAASNVWTCVSFFLASSATTSKMRSITRTESVTCAPSSCAVRTTTRTAVSPSAPNRRRRHVAGEVCENAHVAGASASVAHGGSATGARARSVGPARLLLAPLLLAPAWLAPPVAAAAAAATAFAARLFAAGASCASTRSRRGPASGDRQRKIRSPSCGQSSMVPVSPGFLICSSRTFPFVRVNIPVVFDRSPAF